MTDQTQQIALSLWIRDELKNGIVLTDDVLHYIEATFGTRDLPSVLVEADACELDSLMELLFYPDAALQERYEAQWGRELFSEHDQNRVIALLCEKEVVSEISLPQNDVKISIPVPDFASRTFVERLNICWHPPAQLSQLLEQQYLGKIDIRARVQLRNARLAWHKNHVALISLFISKMPATAETFVADLDFLFSILSEMAEEGDAYAFLIGKKFFYFKSLCSAEDFDRKRLTSNMEILMMSGARSAHGSIDEWRQCMRRVDRICQYLFGRTQFFQQPDHQCIDLEDGMNLKDVTRMLS